MTSRSTFGGNEQSTGSHYGHGTQPDSYYPITYSSAAYEPDVNLSLSATSSQPTNLALGERPLFAVICSALKPAQLRKALLNVLLVGGAVGMIITVATAFFVVPFWLFFVGE